MVRLGILEILAVAAVVGALVMAVNRNGRAVASVLLGGLGLVAVVGVGLMTIYWSRSAVSGVERQEYRIEADLRSAEQALDQFTPRWRLRRSSHPLRSAEQALDQFTQVTLPAGEAEIEGAVPEIIAGAAQPVEAPTSDATPSSPAEVVPAQSRPEWVGQPSGLQGDTYRHIGYVGPYETAAECDVAEPVEIERAVRHYAEELLPGRFGAQDFDAELAYASLRGIAPTVARFDETIDSPTLGPMIQRHVQVEFDRDVQQQIVDAYRQAVVSRRLTFTGVYSGLALACLGAMFGYLRLDTATRGYYSGRLKTAAGAVIAAAVAAGAVVWQRL